jgi:hypothetical protein
MLALEGAATLVEGWPAVPLWLAKPRPAVPPGSVRVGREGSEHARRGRGSCVRRGRGPVTTAHATRGSEGARLARRRARGARCILRGERASLVRHDEERKKR